MIFCIGLKSVLSDSARNVCLKIGCFGPKKDEVTGKWRRLHYEKLYDLYIPPNILVVWVIIPGKTGWGTWHVMGKIKFHTGFWLGNLREGDYFKDLGLDKKIILKLICMERDGGAWDWTELVQRRDRRLL